MRRLSKRERQEILDGLEQVNGIEGDHRCRRCKLWASDGMFSAPMLPCVRCDPFPAILLRIVLWSGVAGMAAVVWQWSKLWR